ncbi:SDR family NAD(P)-dependent oxidoreductase [Curvivirga aplysinae]|uniref:SDR family NAD(P)-dependent oxidoreductase n=1 Tax=Curvivirga aplysinae TaxID=2529852 RepID=UPI0012BCF826|nr:SDR family oxidoreductase [Curvivirga aplysinae]MTI11393.1 SDR family oxidoreductase [Curvivirga aplysinae]
MPYSTPENSPSLNNLFSLEGKDALVIGGAGLLGGEISYAFAELGARVFIASRDVEKCRDFAATLRNKHPNCEVHCYKVDISDKVSILNLMTQVGEVTDGSLDILVNSGWSGRKNTFESISDEDWDNDIEICLNGVFRSIKAAVPLLKKRQGNILTIASMYGHIAPDYRLYDNKKFSNPPSYGAAKAGVLQLTRYLASFLSPDKIRANCISPGPFPFESTQLENPEFIERLSAKNPLNRIGKPEELKGAAALLCTEAGSYMTGQNICIDGGWAAW